MPLNIHTGNRMENLVEALASLLVTPLASPLTPEVIVVQSKGMQRWLAMELSRCFGVWANCRYPFPNDMVWRLFRAVLPRVSDAAPFAPEIMAWKIMALLPSFLERESFAPLRRYLDNDRDGLKLFQVSEKIADTLDQYTLFRPDMLLEWEEGGGQEGDAAWQASLWRELAREGEGMHRGRLLREYCDYLTRVTTAPAGIPERISLFGISYLPSFHMDVLAATARFSQVNLFLLSPTREYWSDITPRRVLARLAPEERALRDEGNPLLASLGRVGRDFSDRVIEIGDLATRQEEHYREPGDECLLRSIQSRILNLDGAGEGERRPIALLDRSIQLHSCHGPLREIEVLHDNLLALLEREEGLEPRHILVMTPDIESYAPYVATVFEGGEGGVRIPYSIADRSLASEGEVAATLLKLLALPGSRLTVLQLLDILETPVVSRRFGLDGEELERVRRWLGETRVAWGMDEGDRLRLGLPGYRDNSWRAGLDRLLLGYAMPDVGGRLFNGLLPYDGMEGNAGLTLGKLADFVDAIDRLARDLAVPRPLPEWGERFRQMLAEFIAAADDTARELDACSALVAELDGLGERARFHGAVRPAVMRAWLGSRLRREQKGLGFMTGGVTFCAMLPMRSIPFRVVALIGMSDGVFPRQGRPPGFDLIARHPRRGDRSLRDEDRYLFLEAILSARDCLYLSYIGQSMRDESQIPPSVLLSELLDSVERQFLPVDGGSAEERLVTRHRLQPFSGEYFAPGSPLFSYSAENCQALREKLAGSPASTPFMNAPLREPTEEWRDLTLERLIRFFRNPARFFLEQRLGIRLDDPRAPLEEREPLALDRLEAYSLRQELLELLLAGGDPDEHLAVVRARGILPPARHGELLYRQALEEAQAFARLVREEQGEGMLAPLDRTLELGRFRLAGRLERIGAERMLRYRCAAMRGRDQLKAWLEHLFLNALGPEGYPRESVLVMTDGKRLFGPVEGAAAILEELLRLYWQGLMRPLPFFPDSSFAYAHRLEWDLERACKAWEGGYVAGEGEERHFRLCFGPKPPFDDRFQQVSRLVLEPLIRHQG